MRHQTMSKSRRYVRTKSDYRYYSAVTSLPILVIVGIAVGFLIGESFNAGKTVTAFFTVLGAISAFAISIYQILSVEKNESKRNTNRNVKSLQKFAKRAKLHSDIQSEDKLETNSPTDRIE